MDEEELLRKGLQYNLYHQNKNWLKKLVLEADTAVSLADPHRSKFFEAHYSQKVESCIS
jgi:hypothetical protein